MDDVISNSVKAERENQTQVNEALFEVAHQKLNLDDTPATFRPNETGSAPKASFAEAFSAIIAENTRRRRGLATLDPIKDEEAYQDLTRQIETDIARAEKMITQLSKITLETPDGQTKRQFSDEDIANFQKILESSTKKEIK